MHAEVESEIPKRRFLVIEDIDGRIILKWILKEEVMGVMNVTDSCQHGN
jgi:hypothetical protein